MVFLERRELFVEVSSDQENVAYQDINDAYT